MIGRQAKEHVIVQDSQADAPRKMCGFQAPICFVCCHVTEICWELSVG